MTDARPFRSVERRARPPERDYPTFDEVAQRVYQLFVVEGRRVERVLDYWQRAEDELLNQPRPRTPR